MVLRVIEPDPKEMTNPTTHFQRPTLSNWEGHLNPGEKGINMIIFGRAGERFRFTGYLRRWYDSKHTLACTGIGV
jgi:hypothetical protein